MNEFECEVTDDGDILVRHVRQGHEYIFDRGAQGAFVLDRTVKGSAAVDDPDAYTEHALAFAGQKKLGR